MYKVTYLADSEVNEKIDEQLRALLSTCFSNQPIFLKQRYFYENPSHRWLIHDNEKIVAHVAVHDKTISVDKIEYRIGGVAEVCVHPDYRGKGLVGELLKEAHKWMKEQEFDFAFLFANHPNVYSPSGYFLITNPIKYYEPETNEWHEKIFPDTMVCSINNKIWQKGLVNLNGPKF